MTRYNLRSSYYLTKQGLSFRTQAYDTIVRRSRISSRTANILYIISLILLNIFSTSFSQSTSCGCDLVPCAGGTYNRNVANVSTCDLIGYFAFEQGSFLQDSSSSSVNLNAFRRSPSDFDPTQSIDCLFSTGCIQYTSGGVKLDDFSRISVGGSLGLSVCLWYRIGSSRSASQRLFDFGLGPNQGLIILTRLVQIVIT